MDEYSIFALAAIGLAAIRYGTYLYTIYQGKTKPHAFTWLLLGSVTSVGTWAQFEMGAGPSTWAMGFIALTSLFIATLSFFIGEKDYTKSDWVALIVCFMAIPIWKMTDNAIWAVTIVVIIDILSYWPTIRKSYNKPHTEPPISAVISGVRYLFVILAVPEPNFGNMMYPFYLLLVDWGFALYIVIRRWQLGYPLHEYVKAKD
ncbi:MAG: hypothetical protein OXR68_02880 [Alphaproteobacteria bacterium]|nr:hypothetical protein [Alphaproteobacteria bacterium]MDD9919548.1 hypothetical protein [Alphaproteobacteria bacterium]